MMYENISNSKAAEDREARAMLEEYEAWRKAEPKKAADILRELARKNPNSETARIAEKLEERDARLMLEEYEVWNKEKPKKAGDILRELTKRYPNSETARIAEKLLGSADPGAAQSSLSELKNGLTPVAVVLLLPILGMILFGLMVMSVFASMAFDAGFSWYGLLLVSPVWGATIALGLWMLYLICRLFAHLITWLSRNDFPNQKQTYKSTTRK